MTIFRKTMAGLFSRVLHAAAENGFYVRHGRQLCSPFVPGFNGAHEVQDKAWTHHLQSFSRSSSSRAERPSGSGLSATCIDKNPSGSQTPSTDWATNAQLTSISSLTCPQETLRQIPRTNAKYSTRLQHWPPETSGFQLDLQHEGQLSAPFLPERQAGAQFASGADPRPVTASSFGCPPGKRVRHSDESLGAASTTCMQPYPTAAISNYDYSWTSSGQHVCCNPAGMITGQTAPANHIVTSGFLASDGIGQSAASIYGGQLDRQRQDISCPLFSDRMGSSDFSRANAPACAITAAASAWDEHRLPKRQDGEHIRLMVPESERHLASLFEGLAQPVSSNTCCLLAERLPALKSINSLQGIAARSPKYQALYSRNIQVIPWVC